MSSIKIFPPNWNRISGVTYNVIHSDEFEFNGKLRPTLNTQYHVALKYNGEKDNFTRLRVEWPQGIWAAINHLQSLGDLKNLVNDIGQHQPFYCDILVDRRGNLIGPENRTQLAADTKASFEYMLHRAHDLQRQKVKATLRRLVSDIEVHLMPDLELIYEMVGSTFEAPGYYNTESKIRTELIPDGYSAESHKIHHLFCYEHLDDGYLIEALQGVNLFSSDVRHQFKLIHNSFMGGTFNIDDHNDISLNYYYFLMDKQTSLLKKYVKLYRTASSTMKKSKTVAIEQVM